MESAASTTGWVEIFTAVGVCVGIALVAIHMVMNCQGRKKVLRALIEHQSSLAEGAVQTVVDDHHQTAEDVATIAVNVTAQMMRDDVLRERFRAAAR